MICAACSPEPPPDILYGAGITSSQVRPFALSERIDCHWHQLGAL
jgi:hypothetical protein